MITTILVFILVIAILVLAHEFGHFITARFFDVEVQEFAFGFPPRLAKIKKGETKYVFNLLPIGGYVKMLGEDKEVKNPRSFSEKKSLERLAIVVAGVLANFILAIIVLSLGFSIGMTPLASSAQSLGGKISKEILITEVLPDSPAEKNGLASGMLIAGFEGADSFRQFTRENLGQEINLKLVSDHQKIDKKITLSSSEDAPLGVGIAEVEKVKLPILKAIAAGFTETFKTIGMIVSFVGKFFVQLFSTGKVAEGVSGPIGIFNITGQAARLGFSYVLGLLALLSINLGVINIIPFPALDGGRGLFILLESIIKRKVLRTEIENALHLIGFVLLIIFIILVTYHDIIKLR